MLVVDCVRVMLMLLSVQHSVCVVCRVSCCGLGVLILFSRVVIFSARLPQCFGPERQHSNRRSSHREISDFTYIVTY
jgi:hypothetical protein